MRLILCSLTQWSKHLTTFPKNSANVKKIFCIPSAWPSSVLGIHTAFFPIQQFQAMESLNFKELRVSSYSALLSQWKDSPQNTGWFSCTVSLRMLNYKNNWGISPLPVSTPLQAARQTLSKYPVMKYSSKKLLPSHSCRSI